MLAVSVNSCRKKTLQTKAAAHARHGPAFGADARFSLKMERNRTAKRTHERALRIDRGLIVANSKFHRFLKSYSQHIASWKSFRRRTKCALQSICKQEWREVS